MTVPSRLAPVATLAVTTAVLVVLPAVAHAQARRGSAAQLRTEPAMMTCPSVLGEGAQTKQMYCDVLIGRDPAGGILIMLPPHTGDVTLTFDLHNRHTYSEAMTRANRAYHRYTASIGVLTADNTLISRAVVENEFRTEADLIERITGGSGPAGLKAVAPTGLQSVSITIPGEEESVSILGEKLSVIRADGVDQFSTPGRPIAVISNVMVQYRPAPARRAPRRR